MKPFQQHLFRFNFIFM